MERLRRIQRWQSQTKEMKPEEYEGEQIDPRCEWCGECGAHPCEARDRIYQLKVQLAEARAEVEQSCDCLIEWQGETPTYHAECGHHAAIRAEVERLRQRVDTLAEAIKVQDGELLKRVQQAEAEVERLEFEIRQVVVARDINMRGLEQAETKLKAVVEALGEAAMSLETISATAGMKGDEYLRTFLQVRGYANSRASVAIAAAKEKP